MRAAFWSFCLLIWTLCSADGASVTLAWDASPSVDVVLHRVDGNE